MNESAPVDGKPREYAGIPRRLIPWFPSIDLDVCKPDQCELDCIAACPQHVYEKAEGKVIVARPYDCTVGDISCSFQCPEDAISFPSRAELRDMLEQARKQ